VEENGVDSKAAVQLRCCTREKASWVMAQGTLVHARNPSSALASRIREADRLFGFQAGGASGSSGEPTEEEIDRFLTAVDVEPAVCERFRALAPHIVRQVLDRGPLSGSRNPAGVLMTRIRDAEAGRSGQHPGEGLPAPPPGQDTDPEVERLISCFHLDARAATALRSLSSRDRRWACRLPLREARNPSAYIMSQLGLRSGGGSGGGGHSHKDTHHNY